MTYPTIRTAEELRSFMESVVKEDVSDSNLIWFIAYFNASLMLDSYTTKDLAAMLTEGYKPITYDDVQPFIDTFYEDVEEEDYYREGLSIVRFVFYFYSKYEEENAVVAEIESLEFNNQEDE